MSDQKHEGTIGALTDLSGKLINTLPPAFLLLVLLNVAFLALVMWFLNSQIDQRTAMVSTIINRCMDIALHTPAAK